jgi:hypothetical protein
MLLTPQNQAIDKSKRDDVAVKIDRTLAHKAKPIASRRGMTLAEYLSEANRPMIEREFAKVVREMGTGDE